MNSIVGSGPTGLTSGFIQNTNTTRQGLLDKISVLESSIAANQESISKLKAVLDMFPDPMNVSYTQTTSGSLPPQWINVNTL